MNREEEIKGAIVVFPDQILFGSPALNDAADRIAFHSTELVNFIQTIDSELSRAEATYVAASIIDSLPEQLAEDPEILAELKKLTQEFRRSRK